jgi:hypothetical protein
MTTSVSTISQTVLVGPITALAVTEPVQDAESGNWFRDVRVQGMPTDASQIAPVDYILRLWAPTREALGVITPQLQF